MSWDVMVFNFRGSPPDDIENLPDDFQFEPLGKAASVRAAISQSLPGTDWSDPTWGQFEGEGFSIEFNLGNEATLDNFMMHVRGGGDAIAAILKFVVPNQWSLLDCSTGEFIDPENPSQEGWEGFQEFRDHVFKKLEEDESSSE